MTVAEKTSEKMTVDNMSVDKMTVDNISVDKMIVDELTSCKNAYLANKFIFLKRSLFFSFEIVLIKLF
jgi:hypothetical protein